MTKRALLWAAILIMTLAVCVNTYLAYVLISTNESHHQSSSIKFANIERDLMELKTGGTSP